MSKKPLEVIKLDLSINEQKQNWTSERDGNAEGYKEMRGEERRGGKRERESL